eukprot:8220091-Prorocentrum_lima.AAC.1
MEDRDMSRLFQRGGVFAYAEGSLDLRMSAEYVAFSRGHGEAVEEAIARFEFLHAVAHSHG